MISLLTPTRGRPDSLERMAISAIDTAQGDLEFVLALDADDPELAAYHGAVSKIVDKTAEGSATISRERENLSQLFQFCYENAKGDIFMSCDDDVVFRTKGWDTMVKAEFEKVSDKILLVYGDDGSGEENKTHGPHPFIHRNWVEAVGRYLPPHFRGDFCDTWLNDLADGVGRKVKIDALFEHLHPAFNKGVMDKTRKEKIDHHFENNMPDVYYKDTVKEREEDIKKLQGYIDAQA